MRSEAEYRVLVEQALESQLDSLGDMPAKLNEAMKYSLMAGGKRFRAVLLLSSCEAAGGDTETAMPFACALEMIHAYSLIHDDLPAMDDDDLRRGKPTNHKVYGEALAILAGDGLLSAAMELMLKAALQMNDLRGTRAAYVLSSRAGVCGMVGGQTMDVTSEGEKPTLEKVTYIHHHKTADLITAPVEAGLILAGATEEQIAAAADYGMHLGLAFQMIDDLLDVEGDAALMGKNTGMDSEHDKMTWVALHGVEQTRLDAAQEIARAVEACRCFDREGFFASLAERSLHRLS